MLNRPGARLLADATVRLPTSSAGRPLDPIDLPPGDHQLDIALSLEGAIEGTHLALWTSAGMELQQSGTFEVRLAGPTNPLAPASSLTTVSRNPGNILRLSIWPALRLTDELRVMMTGDWQRRGDDRVTDASGTSIPALELETGGRSLAIGGGLWYRSVQGRHGRALPIEAGLVYRTVFTGSGGMTPVTRRLDFGLRLYYKL